ncbi:MAG: hypothetical protein DRQ55_05970 [Planctomycetota bacterium]|nr:MAG: hypothetical protein DRQ55_05970 [Planctomycetota bacterium]
MKKRVPSAERIAGVLRDRLGFAQRDVAVRANELAHFSNIAAKIEALGSDLPGPDNVLLVASIGHGFRIDGERRCFTHTTQESGGSYTGTVSDLEHRDAYSNSMDRTSARDHERAAGASRTRRCDDRNRPSVE